MISQFLDCLSQAGPASQIVLESASARMSRSDLLSAIQRMAEKLQTSGVGTMALHSDNGAAWIISDLACQLAGVRIVPVPLFFSASQIRHAISSSGCDALLTDRKAIISDAGFECAAVVNASCADSTTLYALTPNPDVLLPPGTQKITFTSGTTGTPKGVCLSSNHQFSPASALATVTKLHKPRHLCVLPLSTLLENLAGVYAPLQVGGTVVAPPLDTLGMHGSSGLDIQKLLRSIEQYQPNSLILVPEILNGWVIAAENGWQPPASLQFVAVGGARLAPALLRRARNLGIPAFEGYGLSECASVVSLNVPGAERSGTVGRPLPHLKVSLRDGELIVRGNSFLGYANQPDSWHPESVTTGDLGHMDAEGFIHIDGRAKAQLVTSFGRNVAPEWVESELLAGPLLEYAVVIGDARPYCVALLRPREPSTTDQCISAWIDQVNESLPDYARVREWRRLPKVVEDRPDIPSSSGLPRRENIEHLLRPLIDGMYGAGDRGCNA